MKISKEAKVGILAVVSMTILYFGFNYLKGSEVFSRSNKFYVIYDNIDGLAPSNSILLNGLAIGRVERIDILQTQNNKLLVTLDVNEEIIIRQGTRAVLADSGPLGGKLVRLELNMAGQPLDSGDTLVGGREKGISAQVQEKLPPVLAKFDSLMIGLNGIVKGFAQTEAILNRTLASADLATGTLNSTLVENRQSLREMLGNVNRLTASLVQTEKELKPILAKASTFTDSLNALHLSQTLESTNQTIRALQQMLADINRGQGTLGKLKSDEKLYANMTSTTASLDKLLTDLRENPKRYVHFSIFGAKDKKKKDGTTQTVPVPGSVTTPGDTTQAPVDQE
ncbi:MlaD family protein [Tellurirhabdus bombi]|uniref:MlaD family protein n=1 Tax=Tellurirhabdus bombi TaxID=2907205 RepID=UPI001F201A2C|nr:MlaD family protein [Tellurirhabdus bombi]